MWFKAAACLLSLLSFADAAAKPGLSKRADTVQIYAYGNNISGLAIYAGDNGLAYISNSSTLFNPITWTIDTTGELPWNVTSNSSTITDREFYIVTDSDAYDQVGFAKPSAIPSNATTTGFRTYGPYIMYRENDTLVSEFWAQKTNTSGVWKLKWNQEGPNKADSVPVSLKTTAPVQS